MANGPFGAVKYLAFDIFGTVMDLTGSLTGPVEEFLSAHGSQMSGEAFYADWRDRQRIEQYQDSLLMLGHSGYLETCRRAFVYCLKTHNVSYTDDAVQTLMETYKGLQPFDDAIQGLRKLAKRYKLVALSNGEQWYLEELLHNNVPITVRCHNIGGPSRRIQAFPMDIPKSCTAAGMRARGDHDGCRAFVRYPGGPKPAASERPTSIGTDSPRRIQSTSLTSSWTTSSS